LLYINKKYENDDKDYGLYYINSTLKMDILANFFNIIHFFVFYFNGYGILIFSILSHFLSVYLWNFSN